MIDQFFHYQNITNCIEIKEKKGEAEGGKREKKGGGQLWRVSFMEMQNEDMRVEGINAISFLSSPHNISIILRVIKCTEDITIPESTNTSPTPTPECPT